MRKIELIYKYSNYPRKIDIIDESEVKGYYHVAFSMMSQELIRTGKTQKEQYLTVRFKKDQ